MLTVRDRALGQAFFAQLPPEIRAGFDALSPVTAVSSLHARLYVMYDRDDPLLPFTGSRAVCRVAEAMGQHPYCSGFAIFKHVDPTRGGNPVVVAHDVLELYMHAFAVVRRLQ